MSTRHTAVIPRPYRLWIAGFALAGALAIAVVGTLRSDPATAAIPKVTMPTVELTPAEHTPPEIERPPPRDRPRVAPPQRTVKKSRPPRRAATTSARSPLEPPPPMSSVPSPPNPSPTDLDAPLPH